MNLDDLELSWNEKESLTGKVALVTGASNGIGASIIHTALPNTALTASALRLETIDQGIRVTTIQPGAVATESSQVAWYSEDEIHAFASKVLPVHPDDVAEAALYALEQPEHVSIPELTIMPSRQAQRFK